MKRNRLKWILLLLTLALCLPSQAQDIINGHLVDEDTGENIGFATVQYKGHQLAAISGPDGRFVIRKQRGWKLTFSAVGYKSKTIAVTDDTDKMFVSLKQDTKSLKEVTVKSKRRRYRRKDNPAVELMRRVIAKKKQTDLSNRDFYQYTKYQKLTLALNDVKPEFLSNPKFGKYKWLTEQVETCEQTGKLILPASVDETVSQKIYRRSPHDEKTIIKGQKSIGVNDFFQTGDMLNIATSSIRSRLPLAAAPSPSTAII